MATEYWLDERVDLDPLSDPLNALMYQRGEVDDDEIEGLVERALGVRTQAELKDTRFDGMEIEQDSISDKKLSEVLNRSVQRALRNSKNFSFDKSLDTLIRMGLDQEEAITLLINHLTKEEIT